MRATSLAAGVYPSSLVSGTQWTVEADTIVGIAPGGPVTSWPDGSGNNLPLTDTMGAPFAPTAAPIFQGTDGDLLPWVEFDGVTQGLGSVMPVAYSGLELTTFMVMRRIPPAGAGAHAYLCIGRAGLISGNGAGTFKYMGSAGTARVRGLYQNQPYRPENDPDTAMVEAGAWGIHCARWAVRGGRALLNMWRNNSGGTALDFGGAVLPAWSAVNFLALGWDPAEGTRFSQLHVRAASVYLRGLTDEEVKQNLRYYAHKWKVAVID